MGSEYISRFLPNSSMKLSCQYFANDETGRNQNDNEDPSNSYRPDDLA